MNSVVLRSPRLRRASTVVALIGAVLVPLAPIGLSPAAAEAAPAAVDTTDEVAAALRRDPVFVDPAAERALTDAEADALRARISEAGTPIYIAILPGSVASATGGDANAVLAAIIKEVGLSGTYAVLVGDSLRAGNTSSGAAGQLASASIQAHRGDGAAAVLMDFVDRIESAAAGTGSSASGGSSSGRDGSSSNGGSNESDSGGIGLGSILLVGAAGGAGVWAWRRSRRAKLDRVEQARADEADRQMIRAELSVLADDVLRFEHDVLLHPEAQEDYDAAVHRYRAAEAALGYADEPIDLVRVRRVVDEANYSMARAKAIAAGRTPPEPPAELRQPGRHGEPAIDLDAERRPTYVGYGGPFQTGWFGGGMGGGGLFSGLLLGSMFGGFGPFGFGGGWGGTTVINEGDTYNGDGGGGFGDFGGGDFGGGDFGGDFGGGDF